MNVWYGLIDQLVGLFVGKAFNCW